MTPYRQAHLPEPEPSLTPLYLVQCLLCLGLLGAALLAAYVLGWVYFG